MEGYGMRVDNLKWKSDCYDTLFLWACADEDLKEQIYGYYKENCADYPSPESGFVDFVDTVYENGTYLWDGIEGFLTDLINLYEYGGDTVFQYEDSCIFVPAYIPLTKESRIVTQEDIIIVLCKYVQPLVEEPARIDWYTIRED